VVDEGAVLEDQAITLSHDPEQMNDDALAQVFDWLARHAGDRHLLAVGHRVVHGGTEFDRPVRITPQVMQRLAQLAWYCGLVARRRSRCKRGWG
jgi:acetate kinase